MITGDQIAQFHRDGFLLVEKVFDASEIAAFSAAGRSAVGPGSGTVSLLTIPAARELWADPRLLEIVRALLGPHKVAFFGEANYARYSFTRGADMEGRHLHHDAKGSPEHLFNRVNAALPFTYPSVRIGIYLQDFSASSGGLKVTPGSHRMDVSTFNDTDFTHVNVPSKPGDAIFFTPRTLHSPFGMRLRADPSRALAPSEENALMATDPGQFLPWPLERESIFIDYVGEHELTDLLIKSRGIYPSNIKTGAVAAFPETLATARRAGIGFRADHALVEAMIRAAKEMTTQGLSEKGRALLRLAPALCAQSAPTSAYFPLFSSAPREGDSDAIIATANEIIANINKYLATLPTMRRDAHMNPVDFGDAARAGHRPAPQKALM